MWVRIVSRDVDEATLIDVHVDVEGEGFLVRTRISSRDVPMPVNGGGFGALFDSARQPEHQARPLIALHLRG